MVFLDLSGIILPPLIDYYSKEKEQISEKVVRSVILHKLFEYKLKYKHPKVVVALDSKAYWRKDVFPYYKQNRTAARDKSIFNWPEYYKIFDGLKQELKENIPYTFIEVAKCEADDIIYVLAANVTKEHIIVSGDKDLIQIQYKNPFAKQWSNKQQKYLDTVDYCLNTHIIKGDSADGIPNIFSDDDTIITPGKRQIAVTKAALRNFDINTLPDIVQEKYNRNRLLIDLSQIPKPYFKAILESYLNYPAYVGKGTLQKYLIRHRIIAYIDRLREL
jgi:hypothetical protein